MTASLRALLAGILDYAGLFPPAQLPLDQAIRNYARYRQDADAWMLGRFVIPATRLPELEPFADEFFPLGTRLDLSVLGQGSPAVAEFLMNWYGDMQAIDGLRQRLGDRVRITSIELKLPEAAPTDFPVSLVGGTFPTVDNENMIDKENNAGLVCFIEPGSSSTSRAALEHMFANIKDWRTKPKHCEYPGLKVRCGGLEASAFPSAEQLAFAIAGCRDTDILLKFTAGLHHPIRRFDASVQTKMHGFLNVFGAGVLAHARTLSAEQLRPIIEDEDPASFRFDDERFHWKDLSATVAEIDRARRVAVSSFGSCSFDEPRDDLRALGLL